MEPYGRSQNSISHYRDITIRRDRQKNSHMLFPYAVFVARNSSCFPFYYQTSANCQSNMRTTSVLFVALHFSIKSLSFKCQITRNHNRSFQLNFLITNRKETVSYLVDWLLFYCYTLLIRVDSWTGSVIVVYHHED